MSRGDDRPMLATVLGRAGEAIALAFALLLLTAGAAQGKVMVLGGKAYGVTPTPQAAALSSAIGHPGPLSSRRAAPSTVGGPQSQLKYGGGPLMLSAKLYLIFWGPEGSFPGSYTTPIIQYAEDLQADESLTTNELSVAELYANAAKTHITGKVTLGEALFDTMPYPTEDKAAGCTLAPCVTDEQIQNEILHQIEERGWPTDSPQAPEAIYLVFTPANVATCIEPGVCTFTELGYCAYHFQITGIPPSGDVATYADLPYMPLCDSQQAPSGVGGNEDADGTLDSAIHELVEAATDPNAENGYFDEKGEEIADKCTYPTVEEQFEIYGTPLGGSLAGFTAFNQLINGHSYYTQQMWSNAPTQTPATSAPAGCVARIGPTPSFTAPATANTGQIVDFEGGGSYDISHPLTRYEWHYGDGSPADTTSGAGAQHVYVAPGTYEVALTVSDSSGAADASTQTLPIVVTGSPIAAPTTSIASPAEGQTFTLGQTVATSFSCAEAAGGPGIASCTDSNDAVSPGALDTSTLGPHNYTVTARSLDGLSTQAQLAYTIVSPSGGSGSGGTGGGTGGGSGEGTTTTTGSNSSVAPSSLGTPSGTAGSSPTGSTSKASPGGASGKLAHALKTCRKQPRKKRARCIAAAKRRFGPHRKAPRKRK